MLANTTTVDGAWLVAERFLMGPQDNALTIRIGCPLLGLLTICCMGVCSSDRAAAHLHSSACKTLAACATIRICICFALHKARALQKQRHFSTSTFRQLLFQNPVGSLCNDTARRAWSNPGVIIRILIPSIRHWKGRGQNPVPHRFA